MGVKFTDNSSQIKMVLERATVAGLEAAAAEIQSQAAKNTPVDTGQLKGAWGHIVDDDRKEATIGNTLENAIWTEFGTGEYAYNGNGRKTPWSYKDAKGNWHTTMGKKPIRMLHNAFVTKKNTVIRIIEQAFKDGMK